MTDQTVIAIYARTEDAPSSAEGAGSFWIKTLNTSTKVWVSKKGADENTYVWQLIYDSSAPSTGLSQAQVDARIVALAGQGGLVIPFVGGRIYSALSSKSDPADYVEADFTGGSFSDTALITIPAATGNAYLAFAVPVSGGVLSSITQNFGFRSDVRDDYIPTQAGSQHQVQISGVDYYVYVSDTELSAFYLGANTEYRLSQAGA